MGPSLTLDLRASASQIPVARHAITKLCDQLGIAGDLRERIRLATTEACANCTSHAYDNERVDARFVLAAHLEEHDLVVVVRDHGVGMVTRRNPKPSCDAGRGISVIDLICDDALIWSRDGEGTRITMRFGLPRRLHGTAGAAAHARETGVAGISTFSAVIHDVDVPVSESRS